MLVRGMGGSWVGPCNGPVSPSILMEPGCYSILSRQQTHTDRCIRTIQPCFWTPWLPAILCSVPSASGKGLCGQARPGAPSSSFFPPTNIRQAPTAGMAVTGGRGVKPWQSNTISCPQEVHILSKLNNK